MAVASKGDSRSTSTTLLTLPTIEKDAHGAFIAITCDNISGSFTVQNSLLQEWVKTNMSL